MQIAIGHQRRYSQGSCFMIIVGHFPLGGYDFPVVSTLTLEQLLQSKQLINRKEIVNPGCQTLYNKHKPDKIETRWTASVFCIEI